jgi:hypothetical protein
MTRTPTNFGPYENEYKAKVSRPRRLLKAGLQVLIVTLAVILAGLFLFPMGAHDAESVDGAQAVGGFMSAPPAPQASKKAP